MSLIGTVVSPETTRQQKERVNASVEAYDQVVDACTAINAPTRLAWKAFVTGWQSFYRTPEGFWTAGQEYDYAITQGTELNRWGDFLRKNCGLQSPPLVPANANDPHLPDLNLDMGSKVIVGGVVVIALLLLLRK